MCTSVNNYSTSPNATAAAEAHATRLSVPFRENSWHTVAPKRAGCPRSPSLIPRPGKAHQAAASYHTLTTSAARWHERWPLPTLAGPLKGQSCVGHRGYLGVGGHLELPRGFSRCALRLVLGLRQELCLDRDRASAASQHESGLAQDFGEHPYGAANSQGGQYCYWLRCRAIEPSSGGVAVCAGAVVVTSWGAGEGGRHACLESICKRVQRRFLTVDGRCQRQTSPPEYL